MIHCVTGAKQFAAEGRAGHMTLCFADSVDNVYHTWLCENSGTAMISSGLFTTEITNHFRVRDTMIGIAETVEEQGSWKGVTCFYFFLECCISHTSEM